MDTSPFHPWTALRVGTYSRYNLFHALLVRNIVLHLAETGFLPPAGEPNDAVGAVAPYASQARLIQALLEDRLGVRAAGIAGTVHRFQGNEKAAMVLDLTDSLGARLGRFLQAVRIGEDGARLLNVAASRARHHVVLVGNFEYLRAKAPGEAIVRRFIDHFEEHGEALDLKTLLPLAERDWVDGLHRVMPASFDFPEGAAGAFTEGTFYPAFQQDLARARESIVIFSPFATGPGTGRWVDPLRAALGRGVRVRILTRPPEEPGGGTTDEVGELVRALRDLSVAVDLRARMHEKIAILDGRILWHGSLNILSHRDTHESMLRIESPAACGQLARFVSTPAGRRDDVPALDARENPECPKCSGPTVWNDGRYGIYFECEDPDCEGKVDARRGTRGRAAGGDRRGSGRRRPSGRAVKVGRVDVLRFASETEPPALCLWYETGIGSGDTDALRNEVLEIWKCFRADVAEVRLGSALIFAEQPENGGWPRERTFGAAFRWTASDAWSTNFDVPEPCPDVLVSTGLYRNYSDEYGFELTIPPGLKGYWNSARCANDAGGCTCMGDHGRYIPLGSDAGIEAFAGFETEWDEQTESVNSIRKRKGVTSTRVVRSGPITLGQLHGKRFAISYEENGEARIEETVVATDSNVEFFVTLRTPQSRYKETVSVFESILATWVHRPSRALGKTMEPVPSSPREGEAYTGTQDACAPRLTT